MDAELLLEYAGERFKFDHFGSLGWLTGAGLD
jgi:hypothetical protein